MYRWHIEIQIKDSAGYRVSVWYSHSRLLYRKKQVLQEVNNLEKLIGELQEKIPENCYQPNDSEQHIPVLQSVGNPPSEAWIWNRAIRAFLLKEPDLYIPVFILTIPASASLKNAPKYRENPRRYPQPLQTPDPFEGIRPALLILKYGRQHKRRHKIPAC